MPAGEMPQRVVAIVAEALNVPADRVTPSASLIDDLGAESIDFIDILFRLETAFGIKLRDNELWTGAGDPKLITVQTIVHHLQERGIS